MQVNYSHKDLYEIMQDPFNTKCTDCSIITYL